MYVRADGKFIIQNRQGITQAIQQELSLSDLECKKLGSLWTQIIYEFNNPDNVKVSNNKNKIPNKNNNFTVYKDAVVEFSKDSWQRIVNLVNKALGKNIEIDYVALEETDGKPSHKKLPEMISSPELDNWFLDDNTFVSVYGEDYMDINSYIEKYHANKETWINAGYLPSDDVKQWYEDYKKEHGEMNFPTAVKYLNDNPDLPDEIQEYIKKAFAICDGDITKNKQGYKGTCHLLSCKAELDACPQIKDIVENIVVQNNDGTVTVTLFGITEDDGKPYSVTLTNKEIRESYRYNDKRGSFDPDAAALELAYQKLVAYVTEKNKEFNKRIEEIREKQFLPLLNNTLRIMNDTEEDNEDFSILRKYLNENIEDFNNMQPKDIRKKMREDGMWSYMHFYSTDCDECLELDRQERELNEQKYEFGERHFMCNKDDYSEETMGETLGANPVDTFQILTGLKAQYVWPELPEGFWDLPNANELNNQYKMDAYDKFLQNTDIDSTPIVVDFKDNNIDLDIIDRHAYSLKRIYTDDKTGEKMVIVHNPHGRDIAPIPYKQFLENLGSVEYIDLEQLK